MFRHFIDTFLWILEILGGHLIEVDGGLTFQEEQINNSQKARWEMSGDYPAVSWCLYGRSSVGALLSFLKWLQGFHFIEDRCIAGLTFASQKINRIATVNFDFSVRGSTFWRATYAASCHACCLRLRIFFQNRGPRACANPLANMTSTHKHFLREMAIVWPKNKRNKKPTQVLARPAPPWCLTKSGKNLEKTKKQQTQQNFRHYGPMATPWPHIVCGVLFFWFSRLFLFLDQKRQKPRENQKKTRRLVNYVSSKKKASDVCAMSSAIFSKWGGGIERKWIIRKKVC